MPYIICVNQPGCLPEQEPYAVATIEGARQAVFSEAEDALGVGDLDAVRMCREITESGGVVGPLPDGYVIDVRRVTWQELRKLTGLLSMVDREAILDAYNKGRSNA
jgi:hypothetical protein